MNNEFHQPQNYQKFNEYQFINNMFFGAKKTETIKVDNTSIKDLELVTKMSQEFAKTLDLKETLQTSFKRGTCNKLIRRLRWNSNETKPKCTTRKPKADQNSRRNESGHRVNTAN